MKMSDHYTCPHIPNHPRMSLLVCMSRWMVALESGKRSPCRKCTIFKGKLADLVKEVMCR